MRLFLAECFLLVNFLIIKCYIIQNVRLINEQMMLDRLAKMAIDSSVHFSIAAATWLIGTYPYTSRVQVLICGLLASSIDIDHFLQAKSFSIADATSLKQRPFMHNSALLFSANLALLVFMLFCHQSRLARFLTRNVVTDHVSSGLKKGLVVCLLVFTSWSTHHLNDGIRRGLWFGFTSTEPIDIVFYLFLILSLPLAIRWLYYRVLVGKHSQRIIKASYYVTEEV